MNVGELIEVLKQYSPDFPVYGTRNVGGYAEDGMVVGAYLFHKSVYDDRYFNHLKDGDPYVWIVMED